MSTYSSSSSSSRCETPRTSSFPLGLLPRDLLLHVLSRLPTVSLLKLRSVCREWRDIIEDPHLDTMQATGGIKTTRVLLVPQGDCNVDTRLQMGDKFLLILIPEIALITGTYELRASCQGLLCFEYGRVTYLFNPLTQEIASLANANPLSLHSYGMGVDPLTCWHKIVRLSYLCDRLEDKFIAEALRVEVLDQGSRSWRDIGTAPNRLSRKDTVFAAGSIHWKADHRGKDGVLGIYSFDIAKEKFAWTPCPPLDKAADMVDFQGVLGIVDHSRWCGSTDVWVMEESGLWKKEYSVRLPVNSRYERDFSGSSGRKIAVSRWKHSGGGAPRKEISWTVYDPATDKLDEWQPWQTKAVGSITLSLLSPAKLWNGSTRVVGTEIGAPVFFFTSFRNGSRIVDLANRSEYLFEDLENRSDCVEVEDVEVEDVEVFRPKKKDVEVIWE